MNIVAPQSAFGVLLNRAQNWLESPLRDNEVG